MEIKGKVLMISKYGGVKLAGEDLWHNPLPQIKESILSDLHLGDDVVLQLENGKIKDWDTNPETTTKTTPSQTTTNTYTTTSKDKCIIRQSVLKSASSMISINPEKPVSPQLEVVLSIAERCYEWVTK